MKRVLSRDKVVSDDLSHHRRYHHCVISLCPDGQAVGAGHADKQRDCDDDRLVSGHLSLQHRYCHWYYPCPDGIAEGVQDTLISNMSLTMISFVSGHLSFSHRGSSLLLSVVHSGKLMEQDTLISNVSVTMIALSLVTSLFSSNASSTIRRP